MLEVRRTWAGWGAALAIAVAAAGCGSDPSTSSSSSASTGSGGASTSTGTGAGGAGGDATTTTTTTGGGGGAGGGMGGAGGGMGGAGGGMGGAGGGMGGAGGGMGGAGGGMGGAGGGGGMGGAGGGMGGAGGGPQPCVMDVDCDDMVYCNGVEVCDNGACAAGAPPSCDDGVSCTLDVCDAVIDACDNIPDDMVCDDGLFCTGAEVCDPANGDPATGCVGAGTPCDDGVSCTVDACDEGADTCSHVPMDALCDNLIVCDGTEFCNALLGCLSNGAPSCDDGIGCTDDFCDAGADACVHVEDDTFCGNGQFCDGVETCNVASGDPVTGCLGGTPVNCDDNIACTTDACNDVIDQCQHTPVNASCSDSVFCNGAEVCNPNVGCVSGTPINCDDNRSCTADACSEAQQQCVNTPNNAACNDGVYCNGQEVCSLSGPIPTGCVAGMPVSCPSDNIACTVDACEEASNSCVSTPSNVLCPVGQSCVVQQGGCTAAQPCATPAECQDGNLCNGVEVCAAGICQAGTPVDCSDGVACTIDTCDPGTGMCSNAPNDAACNDGFACNGTESCNAQTGCVSTGPVDCDDGMLCTFDQCQEPTGSCAHFPQDFQCDDGILCNGVEVCNAQTGCEPGPAYVCPDDGIACTTVVCDPGANACVHVPDNSLCACGETCSPQNGGCGSFCSVKTCQGKVYACGDCLDNDNDCAIDDADGQCLGPCDNTEDSFYGGIPGQNNSPCKSDCYFDQDTGSGNDDCYWSHKCDPLEVAPNYPPEGSQCAYNPNASIPGYSGDCAMAYSTQSAQCLSYCGPLTPNGCDCFGCCDIPGAPTTVWLGSENPSGTGSCNLGTLNDPTMCKPCTQVSACINTCEHCEICVGKPNLPPDCIVQECPVGVQPCGQPGQALCPSTHTCITGCCQFNP